MFCNVLAQVRMKCKMNVPFRIQVALTSNAFSKIHGTQGKSSIMQPKFIILKKLCSLTVFGHGIFYFT